MTTPATEPHDDAESARRWGQLIPTGPFIAWLDAQVEAREGNDIHEGHAQPVADVAHNLGVTARTVYRYRAGLDNSDEPTTHFRSGSVERMLDRAHVDIVDLYPELVDDAPLEPDAWCPTCRDDVTPLGGVCPWCDTATGTRRPGQHGPTGQKITEARLRELHTLHVTTGASTSSIGRRVYADLGYSSPASADQAIRYGWRRLGLDRLTMSEVMTRAAARRAAVTPPMLDDDAMREAITLHVVHGHTARKIALRMVARSRVTHPNSLAAWLIAEFRRRGVRRDLTPRQHAVLRLAAPPQGVTARQAGIAIETIPGSRTGQLPGPRSTRDVRRDGHTVLSRLVATGLVYHDPAAGRWRAPEPPPVYSADTVAAAVAA